MVTEKVVRWWCDHSICSIHWRAIGTKVFFGGAVCIGLFVKDTSSIPDWHFANMNSAFRDINGFLCTEGPVIRTTTHMYVLVPRHSGPVNDRDPEIRARLVV